MAEHHSKVFRSPINTSISKHLYSFPKTDRFDKARESPYIIVYQAAKDHSTISRKGHCRPGQQLLAMETKQILLIGKEFLLPGLMILKANFF